jgi:hypothetical protein
VITVFRFSLELISSARRVLRSSRRNRLVMNLAFVGLSFASMTACADATGPRSADRQAIDNVMPAVTDARFRLASGVTNIASRQQVVLSLSNLELALRTGDTEKSRTRLNEVTKSLEAYRAKASVGDAADISAMYLMLHAVSEIVGPGIVAAP